MQNVNKTWPCSFKNDMRNWVNFHQNTQKSEKLYIDGLFLSKEISEELSIMTLKSDAKFEEKWALSSKNGMRNLVNFSASSCKAQNFPFNIQKGCVVKNDIWFQK